MYSVAMQIDLVYYQSSIEFFFLDFTSYEGEVTKIAYDFLLMCSLVLHILNFQIDL